MFLELFLSVLGKFDKDRKQKQEEFKKRKEEFDREWTKWHYPSKVRINLSNKYR